MNVKELLEWIKLNKPISRHLDNAYTINGICNFCITVIADKWEYVGSVKIDSIGGWLHICCCTDNNDSHVSNKEDICEFLSTLTMHATSIVEMDVGIYDIYIPRKLWEATNLWKKMRNTMTLREFLERMDK